MQQFKIKNNRLGHVIVILTVLLLMTITFWAFFLKADPIEMIGGSIFILFIIGGIGSVVLFMALRAIILNPDVLVVNEKGFEYNPGGISSGFMEWTNVAEIKFMEVRMNPGQLSGPIWERVLAIKFKDPTLYSNQFNPLMKGLMNLNKNMYDADMFFRLSSFGKQVEEVYELMIKCWNESNNGLSK
jgi:hypothetical protein